MVSYSGDQHTSDRLLSLLRAQADKLVALWSNTIQFDVRHELESVTALTTLVAWPGWHPESAFDFLTIRSFDGDVPAICISPFEDTPRKVVSVPELVEYINTALNSSAAVEVLNAMSERAYESYRNKTELHRQDHFEKVQVGHPFLDSRGRLCAKLSVNGVSGFIKAATLKKLAIPPGEAGSAYGFRDREDFFAKLTLLGPARVRLTEKEVSELVEWARYILSLNIRM
ncbi:hypothetical protein FHS26_006922 [Rhizobium pisi]|uniref:Uncharacterized protein n=1 Tax=Rhizobium pisi TaxID=574561 RepID=A0A427M4S3_9HYPH|nr:MULTISPECIES: hypothetical protein [Rhizobium]MBB3139136.1 hypothetical protein [Rhizobium pisi]RSB58721.1 hypothetical protein EFD55_32975 [Rhizobium pisi]TAV45334.1 hypothetical protein ELI31_26060 [Rhizobium leguminosarum]TAV45892.1 hypothetical protein ELI32_27370 [Rhizobium leguminosarum]TAV63747.1 hypothetical protein ELI30_27140 [Rhizobium leguminosarum]